MPKPSAAELRTVTALPDSAPPPAASTAPSPTSVACICGTTAEPQVFSTHFDLWVCPRCATQRFLPRPGISAPEFGYGQDNEKYDQPGYLYGKELRWSHRQLLAEVEWSGRRVLEIGCFNGFFLDEVRHRGGDVFGVDVNRRALQAGSEVFGLGGRLWPTLEQAQAFGPFDDIVCIDVVEHVDDPQAFVQLLASQLAPRGRLVIAGPTVERRFFDKSDYPPHHKWRFSRPGLARLLDKSGFAVERQLIQHDGLLMLRNFIGKALHGFDQREFYGQAEFAPGVPKSRLGTAVYAAATRVGEWLFRALGISYCSTVILASRRTAA
jgi:SAM-dependent methyltransferase